MSPSFLPRPLKAQVRWWAGEKRLRLDTGTQVMELAGEDVHWLERALNLLLLPVSERELEKQPAEVAEAMELLSEWNVLDETLIMASSVASSSFLLRAGFLEAEARPGNMEALPFTAVFENNEVYFFAPQACLSCAEKRFWAKRSRGEFEAHMNLRNWVKRVGDARLHRAETFAWLEQMAPHVHKETSASLIGHARFGEEVLKRHPLFPHSHCPCAENRPKHVALLETSMKQELAPLSDDMLAKYRDSEFGLFNYTEDWKNASGYFQKLPLCWGGFNLIRKLEYVSTGMHGYMGVGNTLEHVRLVAASEGFERYALANIPPDVVERAFDELKDLAVDPRTFAHYEMSQPIPLQRFSTSTPLWWNWALNVLTGDRRLVPHELVATSLSDSRYPQRAFDQVFSSGGASHVSYEKAIVNGLREVVERDAYMIAWYKKLALPRVTLPDSLGHPYAESLLQFLRDVGISLSVLDLRLDLPFPTFLTVARSEREYAHWPKGGVVLSATCDLSKLHALARGLREIVLHYETLVKNPGPENDYRRFSYSEENLEQGWREWIPNYLHYLRPQHAEKTEFLASGGAVNWDDVKDFSSCGISFMLEELQKQSLTPWVIDLTTEDILPSGFKVVRVVVPNMTDLTPARQSRRLDFPRLEKVASASGKSLLKAGEINPWSHPNA